VGAQTVKIPTYYNLRNLKVRATATALTAGGIAITVGVVVVVAGLLAGLNHAFAFNGDPLNVLLLRKGLDTEYASSVTKESFQIVKTLPALALSEDGQPMASLEVVTGIVLSRRDGSGDTNVTLRGITSQGIQLRPKVKLIEGRWFNEGQREMVAGQSLKKRFDVAVGSKVFFGRGEWTVVGVFGNNGAAQESELWSDVNQVAGESPRPHFSSMLVRAKNSAGVSDLLQSVATDPRLALATFREPDYYRHQTLAGNSMKFIGLFIAAIMGAGSCFAAANAMYASVAYRTHEIAVLRVVGFSRPQILGSFLLESTAMAFLGGVLGVLLLLPFQGFTTGTFNSFTFSEMIFKLEITPLVVAFALGAALLMGIIGGMMPAWSASRQDIVATLRQ
jgi:putative ABC transport system permease protein